MAMVLKQNEKSPIDNRRVVLIKSLTTNNRFYTLVDPASGMKNADIVERIPEDLILGIAYPCLEDGLNDFAIIRTTYETLEYYPGEEEMTRELMEMVKDARNKLVLRLMELKERIFKRKAHFLGTDLEEFKAYALDIVHRGYPRRNLDSMMKLNVFSSVAEAEEQNGNSEPLYHFEFRDEYDVPTISMLPARDFLSILFEDVLKSVQDEQNYKDKFTFDKFVFQKFIALMFVNYATTDPIFYGTNKADYGVSGEKAMDQTPLYIAIGKELREIEAELLMEERGISGLPLEADLSSAIPEIPGSLLNGDVLLGPISTIYSAAKRLQQINDSDANKYAKVILTGATQLVLELKKLNIIPPFAFDPSADDTKS
jgi:hypothetical protein